MEERNYSNNNENCIEWIRNSDTATCTFTQGRYITKVMRLAEKYPDKVKIVAVNQDGSIVAHVPTSAVKINIIERDISDEEREILRDRFKNALETKNGVES